MFSAASPLIHLLTEVWQIPAQKQILEAMMKIREPYSHTHGLATSSSVLHDSAFKKDEEGRGVRIDLFFISITFTDLVCSQQGWAIYSK